MLRPYQEETLAMLYRWLEDNKGNPCIDLPPGAGKSIITAAIAKDAMQKFGMKKVLMLTHRKELIEQNYEKMRLLWPGAPLGIYSASVGRKESYEPIVFAGIQSIQKRHDLLGKVDLVICDECHLISHKDEGGYRSFIRSLYKVNPDLRVIGLSATPYRLGHGLITDKPAIFDDIIKPITIAELIAQGYLAPLRSKATVEHLDTVGVQKKGGEYVSASLQEAVDKADQNVRVVEEVLAFAGDRKKWIFFCSGVKHAEHIAEELRRHGIPAECVTEATPKSMRAKILKAFKDGTLKALTGADILTTGFDCPDIDLIVLLRPTMSPGLYVQMVGRGTRLKSHTDHCIAEGQRVLTDSGLVPIEQVTSSMKVWDGCEFVYHCGVEFRGIQEVISYAGLIATKDHKVWTSNGWETFGECSKKQIAISVTGDGWKEVREAEGYFRNGKQTRKVKQGLHGGSLYNLFARVKEGVHNIGERAFWLQALRNNNEGNRSAQVVAESSNISKTKVHEQGGFRVSALRRAWNYFRVRLNVSDGIVGAAKLRFASSFTGRPHRQQWALCKLEHSSINPVAEFISHKEKQYQCSPSLDQDAPQRNKIFGRHGEEIIKRWTDRNGNTRETEKIPTKAEKRKVFDIRNAGPLHRFTVEGLLVSNCLVLDFAGVVAEHGPVTMVQPPKKAGKGNGEAPVKLCDSCAEICHAAARICPCCGYQFPPPKEKELFLHGECIMGIENTQAMVEKWSFHSYMTVKEVECLLVKYFLKGKKAPITEYLLVYHPGWVGQDANRTLKRMAVKTIGMPALASCMTITEVAKAMNKSKSPSIIEYKKDGKYPKILDRRWHDNTSI